MDTVELTRDAVPPMFAFTDEHQALREVVRALFSDTDDPATGWRRLLGEIGADEIILGSTESDATGSPIDLAILAEEAGAALFGGPLIPTVLAGQFAAALGDADLISALRDGTQTVAATLGDDSPVWHGPGAHLLLVRRGGWVALFDATDPDVVLTPVDGLDPSRPLARHTVGAATPIARSEGESTGAEHIVSLALSAELLGVAQHALDGTVQYVAQRVQFGRTIGSFQAVKHRLVDLLAKVELTRSAVYGAAWQLTSDPGAISTEVDLAVAAALSRDTALAVTKAAIQLHGGIAITYEHWAHRYFRRAHAVTALTGTAGRYRRRLADLVDLRDGAHV